MSKMALVHNLKNILSEHDMALREDALERKEENNLDWEALAMTTDAMTDMVYKNINENVQKSFFGKFIKPTYFEKSIKGKSPLDYAIFAHGFCVVTHIGMDYIDLTVDNNPFTDIVEEFSDLIDLKELSFVLTFNTRNSDLSCIENYEIHASVDRSEHTHSSPTNYLMSFDNSTHLKNGLKEDDYPDYCDTRRKKVIYTIFKYDSVCKTYNIDLEYIVNHYHEAHSIINDYLLVNAMEKI